jgi:uncharacterized UBP type Zn finger protein
MKHIVILVIMFHFGGCGTGVSDKDRKNNARSLSALELPLGEPGTRGLKNLGNTCYWNSIMQILMHSVGVKSAVSEMGLVGNLLLDEVSALFSEEYRLKSESIDPAGVFGAFQALKPVYFDVKIQQDPDEAFMAVYELLMSAVNASRPDMLSKFNLFEFIAKEEIFCSHSPTEAASSRSVVADKIMLPLPLIAKGIVDLETQLLEYFEPEVFEGLEICGYESGKKTTRMATAPNFLVILMKRNFYNRKNNIPVIYPFILRSVQEATYVLSGIVHHHGTSPHSGHYTAEFRHPDSGHWYSADDTRVSAIVAPSNPSRTAYLFIYEKVKCLQC